MNNRTILALAGLAMLSLSAISTIGLSSSSSSAQAQSPQGNQSSNTAVSIVTNNVTMDDVKQHLHTQLDGAIMAAQNNETFGVPMGLGQITQGLAAINTPEYFLFEVANYQDFFETICDNLQAADNKITNNYEV
jgi:hypothetical protein